MYATIHHYLDQTQCIIRSLWFYFANVSENLWHRTLVFVR